MNSNTQLSVIDLTSLTRYAVGGHGNLEEMENGDAYLVADVEAVISQLQPSAAPDGWQLVPVKLPSEAVDAIAQAQYDLDDAARVLVQEEWACALGVLSSLNLAPSPNFAARGAEPAGMQAMLGEINWSESINFIADELEEKSNLNEISQFTSLCEEFDRRGKDIADLRAQLLIKTNESQDWSERWLKERQLSAARQGQGDPVAEVYGTTLSSGEGDDERFYEGVAVRLLRNVPKRTKLYLFASQPTAAPTPHEQEARAAVLEEAAAICDAIFKERGGAAFLYAAQEIRGRAAQAGMLPEGNSA